LKKKVIIAMSGGIDSSVAAAMLLDQNFDVVGTTFRLSESCDKTNVEDAKKISSALGIKHIEFDISKEFQKKVVNYFISEYLSGRTPNPCVICNKKIKFGIALQKALDMKFEFFATGHYAKIFKKDNQYYVKKSEHKKDQSYYFCLLNQNQLMHILTPVANLTKSQVIKIAKEKKIASFIKKESQDICFINGSYRKFMKMHTPDNFCNFLGYFVDENKKRIGRHEGIFNYTVGQRKGLNISTGKRMYVKEINVKDKSIMLSENFKIESILVCNLNFLNKLNFPIRAFIQTRYNSDLNFGTIVLLNDDEVLINFDLPIRFASPGQFAVFYVENILIGGGIIQKIFFKNY